MGKWTAVVTDPLGLAGFALFLVFILLRRRLAPEVRLVTVSFIALAALCLIGGLGLAYLRQPPAPPPMKEASPTPVPSSQQPSQVHQETHGAQSPAVSGVQGNVTIIQEDAAQKK